MNYFRVGDFVRARLDRKDEDFYADVHPGVVTRLLALTGATM